MARDRNQEYDNTNTGALFKNNRRTSDRAPEFRGQITVKTPDGEILEYWVSCWEKTSRQGDDFFSLALDLKEDNDGRDGDDRRRGGRGRDRDDDRRSSRDDDRRSSGRGRDDDRRSARGRDDDRGDPRDRDNDRRYDDEKQDDRRRASSNRDLDDEIPF